MKFDRRSFLKSVGLLSASLPIIKYTSESSIIDFPNTLDGESPCIVPPPLKENSLIAITSPASPTNMTETRYGRRFMKSHSCRVTNGYTVRWQKNQHRYLSNTDEFRANEFMEYIANPDVNAIFTSRGGYGSIRILDRLDYDLIAQNPKMLIGFSDITALLIAIHIKSKIVTYHGPVASSLKNEFSKKYLQEILFYEKYKQPVVVHSSKISAINKGKALGRLIGGNLSVVCSLIGTEFEIDTKDKILFLEDVSEKAHKIDMKLKQLELAGKFENVAGIMFGVFKNLNTRRPYNPNKGYTIKELFGQYFEKYDFPVIYNVPFGHTKENITLPLGTFAEFDSEKQRLVLFNKI